MAIADDVEVEIISVATKKPLEEYKCPEHWMAGSGLRKYFVEAESDMEFAIRVTLKKGFVIMMRMGLLFAFT